MEAWVLASEKLMHEMGINDSVGFRPPVGIRTPPLARTLEKLGLPMILWSLRFYDAALRFNRQRVEAKLPKLQDGSIILLHDRSFASNKKVECQALRFLIQAARDRGLSPHKLEQKLFKTPLFRL